MPDNGKWRHKARRIRVKSWLSPFLAGEQDKEANKKGLVLHSKVAMKGFGIGKKFLQHNIDDLFPGIPANPDSWSLHGEWTYTDTLTIK